MDIQKQPTKNNKRSRPEDQKSSLPVNKDLLRLERPIFQLKKSEENQSEFVIRRLMAKKEKPQIGMVGRSPLLSRLAEMMPVFNKSNQDIQHRVIQQSQKIDAKLQECESQSSSDSQDDQDVQNSANLQKSQKIQTPSMQIQPTHHAESDSMQNEQQQNLGQFLQINFLRYPYLNEQQLAKLQAQNLSQKRQKQVQKPRPKKILIQQITPEQQ